MEIKYGLISADSHAAFDRDDFTRRMSASKWQDRIPRVVEVEDNGRRVHRWTVYDGSPYQESVCNCPALMGDPFPTYPERWEEVPRTAYDPRERLKALDSDRVDAEVLFPNPPGGNYFEFGDAAFELDVVRAYNDALGEWSRISDRYLPVAILPYLSEPKTIAGEIARAVSVGHRGVNVLGQMPKSLPHLTDPRWDPVWSVLPGAGRSHPFPRLGGLARGRVGAQVERLFAAPGALGVHRHLGGNTGANHPPTDFLRSDGALPASEVRVCRGRHRRA